VRQHGADGGDVASLIARHLLEFLQPFQKCDAGHGIAPSIAVQPAAMPVLSPPLGPEQVGRAAGQAAFLRDVVGLAGLNGISTSTASVETCSPRSIRTLTLSWSICMCLEMTRKISSRSLARRSDPPALARSCARSTCKRSRAAG